MTAINNKNKFFEQYGKFDFSNIMTLLICRLKLSLSIVAGNLANFKLYGSGIICKFLFFSVSSSSVLLLDTYKLMSIRQKALETN